MKQRAPKALRRPRRIPRTLLGLYCAGTDNKNICLGEGNNDNK